MPSFSRSLPMLLLWAREAMMQRFRPELHARGLTDQQWRVIRALVDADSCEIYELSARCCMHPASLSRLLPKLAAKGLVARSTKAKDQRCVIVSLTPQGRKVFENGIASSNQIYAQLARDVGAERIEHVTQVLEDLIAALNAKSPSGRARDFADAGLDAHD
jgi:homoprotocatechuate degradation regulator HpaR